MKKPSYYLGKSVKVFLKDGGAFNFKIIGVSKGPYDNVFYNGYDDENLNITIDIKDVSRIMEVI